MFMVPWARPILSLHPAMRMKYNSSWEDPGLLTIPTYAVTEVEKHSLRINHTNFFNATLYSAFWIIRFNKTSNI